MRTNNPNQKYCTKGKHMVDRILFNKNFLRKDGLGSWCKECTKKNDEVRRYNKGIIKAF